MNKRSLAFTLLVLAGCILLIPLITEFNTPRLEPTDPAGAFDPLYKTDLATLTGETSFTVTIPASPAWSRLRAVWGEPGYIVAGVSPVLKMMYCQQALGLEVNAGREMSPAADALNGYASACTSSGWQFDAEPGEKVTIHVKNASGMSLLAGDLIVAPYWRTEMKPYVDEIVPTLRRHRLFQAAALAGVLLLALAVYLRYSPASSTRASSLR